MSNAGSSSSRRASIEEEPPVSISSLRNKFESLAAGKTVDQPLRKPASEGLNGGVEAGVQGKPVSRPVTPAFDKPKPPAIPPPKPIIMSTPASPKLPTSTPVSPRPLRRPAPSVPQKPISRTASPVPVEDEEVLPSVKALRDRFNEAGPSRITEGLQPSTEVLTPPLSSSPLHLDDAHPIHRAKPPPPPPPISRSASPLQRPPPQPDRSRKPSSSRPSPAPSTPSGSRDPSPSQPEPIAAPPLPSRRPTLPDHETAPLDVPVRRGLSADTPSAPPQLPLRARAQTVSRSEDTRFHAPPPLPTRTGTLNIGSLHHHSSSLPSSPQRSRDSSFSTDSYQPPPPPMRSAMNIVSPPREHRKSELSADLSSEDEEEEEPAPLAGLSSIAKRALEDYPDSTHANRRPPRFVPDIRMVQPHHIHSFAVFGRHVCTGAHHVRVYDTQMSERPIFIVDLRETGLEFRIKDPKVTAMGFRPSSHPGEEGRYLWCGTKDGHLWELDIKTGTVTDTRAGVHVGAVTHIFRHGQNVLTLDESGKLHIFEVPTAEKVDSGVPALLLRTVRISDKSTFARMLHGKLWTATAPSARSTTTTASKGATIRVYEPLLDSMPPGKTLFTTEWTGAVTSATILPLKPDQVYIGHEGGFVSIWSNTDLACLQVLKISSTDILALEGVGEKLWAGNRKGQIHVYDVTEKPWQTTNIWTAHHDHSVNTLLVDPWSIEHSGRFPLWSTTRESIHAWDGLLSVDWIDKQMDIRQSDYCTFRKVKAVVCSWNIDSAKPTELVGTNGSFLSDVLGSVDRPEIVVFGFQEVIPLTDKKLTAKTLLFGGKGKEAGATADKVSLAYRQWLEKLVSAVRMASPQDTTYIKVHSESLVGLFTCVFVRSDQKDALRDVDICTVKRGIGGIYGNKGAIIARMVMDDTSLCFINVHLAAGQSQKAARNADLSAIMEDKAILPPSEQLPFVHGGDGTAILDHELVVLNGDLNYRIDQRRENVISNISAGELSYLLEHDQLRKEMRGNHAFRLRSFDEPPITFAPTYKYNRGSVEYDSSEKRRIPAWCDRILYTKSPKITPINYQRYEITVSDHRPISAGLVFTLKSIDRGKMSRVRGQLGEEWAKKEQEMLEAMSAAFRALGGEIE